MSGLDPVNDRSHHNPSGGFTNPWPSFRNITIWNAMMYARKNWNREASKIPPQSELYVKVLQERQMAWERIRNPPKDRIQATWYLREKGGGWLIVGLDMRVSWCRWMELISLLIPFGLIGMDLLV